MSNQSIDCDNCGEEIPDDQAETTEELYGMPLCERCEKDFK